MSSPARSWRCEGPSEPLVGRISACLVQLALDLLHAEAFDHVADAHVLIAFESHAALLADLNFLHFGEATLTFPQTLVLRYGRFETADRLQPQVVEDYSKWFLARLRTLEPLLADAPFLCASRFTAADISVGYALLLAQHLGLHARFTPAVAAYWQRLQARAAFVKALAAQERAALAQGVPITPSPDLGPPQSGSNPTA